MKIISATFETSAGSSDQFPDPLYQEIVFAGRSNVGKSSLLNLLTNTKKLAKVSSTPGKTRLINFFLINNSLRFVDLPGYGFAQTSTAEREKWRRLIETYFYSGRPICLVILLIDSRIPVQKLDRQMLEWLNTLKLPAQIVLTKIDKLKQQERSKQMRYFTSEFFQSGYHAKLIEFSSVTGCGRDTLGQAILESVEKV